MNEESAVAMRSVKEQCEKVAEIHARLLRGGETKESDRWAVHRLIRLLVAEWV